MLIVCLTGGIGSGKSSVAAMLERMAPIGVIDADVVAREVVSVGEQGLDSLVLEFGDRILMASGDLDRQKLGSLVFGDADKLSRLNAILHPLIRDRLTKTLTAWEIESRYDVVVVVIPLLVESGPDRYPCKKIVVVDVDEDVALRRLIDSRDMTEEEARLRIASQAKREERIALADYVIENSGSLLDLETEVEKVWRWLTSCLGGTNEY